MARRLHILGIRGVPGRHGGFETFAENLAPWLAARGWDVTVYCQLEGTDPVSEDVWRGVRRVLIPVRGDGAYASLVFDRRSIAMAAREPGPALVLGYNTAVLTAWLRLRGKAFATNMDGLEWKRAKWSAPLRAWFYVNEWIGAAVSTRLIADHPEIARHLRSRARAERIETIPYGADPIDDADPAPLAALGLEPDRFLVAICRPEPENLVLELVRAFSRAPRGARLAVLGAFSEANPYHRAVRAAASAEVTFPGAIYDRPTIRALRGLSRAYCHGHTVGGTNPSLVEALGAGGAVIAHDNPFNRWVAGEGQFYFADEDACAARIAEALADDARVAQARAAARARFEEAFTWDRILGAYEAVLDRLPQ